MPKANPDTTKKVTIKLTPKQFEKAKKIALQQGFTVDKPPQGDVAAWVTFLVIQRVA